MLQSGDTEQDAIHVFLETSVLLDSHWDLEWPPLQAILKHAGQAVVLHTTTVTLWEVVDVGRKTIEDARQRFRGFKKFVKAPVPRFDWVDPKEFRERYRSLCQYEHTGSGADLGEIIQLWLNQSPPFTEHKPPQFQDAMAFLALHHWARKEKTVVHVVAKDPDWVKACNNGSWCKLADLGALVASLRAQIEFSDTQLRNISDEVEMRMADGLANIAPIVANRPGRNYELEVLNVEQVELSPINVEAESDGVRAIFRFDANATLNVVGRYGAEALCEPRIFGEITVALDPGYVIQDLHVTTWSFNMPDLADTENMTLQSFSRHWSFDDAGK